MEQQSHPKKFSRFFGQFITHASFQLKFACFASAYVALILLVLGYGIHTSFANLNNSGSLSPDMVEQLNILEGIFRKVGVLFLAGSFGLSLFFSHYIAGPVYRFEKVLEEIGRGNLNIVVKLRPKDAFKSLAEHFNAALSALRSNIQKERAEVDLLIKKVQTGKFDSVGVPPEISASRKINVSLEHR